jgi:hypothetical protein
MHWDICQGQQKVEIETIPMMVKRKSGKFNYWNEQEIVALTECK